MPLRWVTKCTRYWELAAYLESCKAYDSSGCSRTVRIPETSKPFCLLFELQNSEAWFQVDSSIYALLAHSSWHPAIFKALIAQDSRDTGRFGCFLNVNGHVQPSLVPVRAMTEGEPSHEKESNQSPGARSAAHLACEGLSARA